MSGEEWWPQRERAGIVSYWLYQYIGNLSPELIRESELLAEVRAAGDGWDVLERFAGEERGIRDGARWSYCRDLGPARLIVVDSRLGRVLDEGGRSMLDEDEWEWLENELAAECDHLLIATSDPFLLAHGLHNLERWGEAVCAGAWGGWAAKQGERLRQGVDFDHWAAFGESFDRLARLIEDRASGRGGRAPRTITVLSGDVHHAYLAEVAFERSAARQEPVWQAVCSPFRNALDAKERQDDQGKRLGDRAPAHPRARPRRRRARRPDRLADRRRPVLRQPGRDADDHRGRRRDPARADRRRSGDRRARAPHLVRALADVEAHERRRT